MKRNLARITFILAFVLSLTAFAQTQQASAAPAGAPAPAPAATGGQRVGIIDIQAAIVSTNEGQRDFQALQKKFDPKRTELEGLQKEVEELKKQLSAQGDKLNDEARSGLARQIETKQKTLQRNYEDANNDLTAQQNEIANRIGQKMMEVVDKYARANNYGVILNVSGQSNAVLWAGQNTDVTQAIVEAYNTQSGVAAPPAAAPAAPSAARPGATAPRTGPPARPATTPAQKPAPPKQ